MGASYDRVKCPLDPFAVITANGQRGQEFDCMVADVARNLREHFVFIEQRNHDQSAEQSAARGLEKIP